jgi:anti-anti-sigma regulatory factor
MSEQATSLYYAIAGEVAWIRVTGRANCLVGVDFLCLIKELGAKNHRSFILDLRDCALMDSSFLGTLAGLEQEFGTDSLRSGHHRLELIGANQRVSDLIHSLGLNEYFVLAADAPAFPEQWIPVPPSGASNSRLLCSKMSLDAHEVIVRLNPSNESKFRDVVSFLKEDVKRLEEGGGNGTN